MGRWPPAVHSKRTTLGMCVTVLGARRRPASPRARGRENGRIGRAGPLLDRMRLVPRTSRHQPGPSGSRVCARLREASLSGRCVVRTVPNGCLNLGYCRLGVGGTSDLGARVDVIGPEISGGAASARFCRQIRNRAGGSFVLAGPARAAGCGAARPARRAFGAAASRGRARTRPVRRGGAA
jgi:hypothetical protein